MRSVKALVAPPFQLCYLQQAPLGLGPLPVCSSLWPTPHGSGTSDILRSRQSRPHLHSCKQEPFWVSMQRLPCHMPGLNSSSQAWKKNLQPLYLHAVHVFKARSMWTTLPSGCLLGAEPGPWNHTTAVFLCGCYLGENRSLGLPCHKLEAVLDEVLP